MPNLYYVIFTWLVYSLAKVTLTHSVWSYRVHKECSSNTQCLTFAMFLILQQLVPIVHFLTDCSVYTLWKRLVRHGNEMFRCLLLSMDSVTIWFHWTLSHILSNWWLTTIWWRGFAMKKYLLLKPIWLYCTNVPITSTMIFWELKYNCPSYLLADDIVMIVYPSFCMFVDFVIWDEFIVELIFDYFCKMTITMAGTICISQFWHSGILLFGHNTSIDTLPILLHQFHFPGWYLLHYDAYKRTFCY